MSCTGNPFGLTLVPGDGERDADPTENVPDPVVPVAGNVPGDAVPEGEPERDHDPEREPGAGTAVVLAGVLPGSRMSLAEQWWAGFKGWLASKTGKKHGLTEILRHYFATPPESIAQYRAYVGSADSRKWIPEGYEEYKLIRYLRGTQVIYHRTAGPAGVAFGGAVAKTFARGRRLAAVIAILTLAVILIAAFA